MLCSYGNVAVNQQTYRSYMNVDCDGQIEYEDVEINIYYDSIEIDEPQGKRYGKKLSHNQVVMDDGLRYDLTINYHSITLSFTPDDRFIEQHCKTYYLNDR